MSRPLVPWLMVPILMLCAGGAAAAPAQPPGAPVAPEFTGITHWINSPPLSMRSLRGKVVLIDFWAFECINCLHTTPHLNALYEKYKDRGLVVVGVHTPELEAERNRASLVAAVRRLGIRYPVAQDKQAATWQAWGTRFWPTQYLVDRQGKVTLKHVGEGRYAEIEAAVRQELGMP